MRLGTVTTQRDEVTGDGWTGDADIVVDEGYGGWKKESER